MAGADVQVVMAKCNERIVVTRKNVRMLKKLLKLRPL